MAKGKAKSPLLVAFVTIFLDLLGFGRIELGRGGLLFGRVLLFVVHLDSGGRLNARRGTGVKGRGASGVGPDMTIRLGSHRGWV